MFKNNFIISVRHLVRNKTFSLINLIGLSLAMMACLLIFKYVMYERSYEDFYEDRSSVFRLYRSSLEDGSLATNYAAITPHLSTSMPEIEAIGRFVFPDKIFSTFAFSHTKTDGTVLSFNEPDGLYADNDVLNIFKLNWLEGSGENALAGPSDIVISSTMAQKYFGDQPATGKLLRLSNLEKDYVVRGVFADLPGNTHLKYNFLCAMKSLPEDFDLDNNWGWGNFYTYLKLANGASPELLEAKIQKNLYETISYYKKEGIQFQFQALEDIHLNSNLAFELEPNGNSKTILFLFTVGIFIMVIAWVNFVNLSTAKLLDRAKEVGVRKVLGSRKKQLIAQYLLESVLLNAVAIILALTVLQSTNSSFESLLNIPLVYFDAQNLMITLLFVGGFTLGAILFGIYPAVLIASIKISVVLKGRGRNTGKSLLLRRALTIFQFSIAAVLIIGTLSVFGQLRYIQNQSLGINMQQNVAIRLPFVDQELRKNKLVTLKNNLSTLSGISATTSSSELTGYEVTRRRQLALSRDDNSPRVVVKDISIAEGFIEQFEIELLAGRSFSNAMNDARSIIINESAAKGLEMTDFNEWIDKEIGYLGKPYKLVGIIKDYNQVSLRSEKEPQVYSFDQRPKFVSVKLQASNLTETMAAIQNEFEAVYPESPFDYFFVDEYFDQQYKADKLFGKVFGFFTVLAIVVTILGLTGLAVYNIAQRSREISIRKVLGASVKSLSLLLSREYIVLIGIATVISLPVGYLLVEGWLSNFAYRMNIQLVILLLPLLILGLLTSLTVGFQVIKAASTNPAETLRCE